MPSPRKPRPQIHCYAITGSNERDQPIVIAAATPHQAAAAARKLYPHATHRHARKVTLVPGHKIAPRTPSKPKA